MPDKKLPVKRKQKESIGLENGNKKPKARLSEIRFNQIPRLTQSGKVLTCGQGDTGQLGLGEIIERKRPGVVSSLENVVDVCAGGMHTVCLTSAGEVFTFGCNDEGGLGRDTSEEEAEFVPGKVKLPGKCVQISAGDSHSATLLEDGRVFAWGSFRDSVGSMGLTMDGTAMTPVELLPGIVIVKIASGTDHLMMLSNDGQLYTCGCGEQGQLGRIPERSANRNARQGIRRLLEPDKVQYKSGTRHVIENIWAGNHCSFAKDIQSEKIYVFGLNNYNQLGIKNKTSKQIYFAPVISEDISKLDVAQICSGQHHTVIRDREGKLYVLGRGEYGRLGLGEDCSDAKTPVVIPTLENQRCVNVTCGSLVSLAVTDKGEVYGWGMGTNNQLGTGNEEDVFEPTLIQGQQLEPRCALLVSAGGQHTVFLAADRG